jgi:hypothetical protein
MQNSDSTVASRHLRPPTAARPLLPEEEGQRHALVIGIDRYREHPLHYAVNDARAVADKLEQDFGFQVTRLCDQDADASAIRQALQRLGESTAAQDIVLIFFAGHGENRPGAEGQSEGYLLPVDATTEAETWLTAAEVIQQARNMAARRVLLLFDACYAGSTLGEKVPVVGPQGQTLMALLAGTSKQPVLDGGAGDHSIFTRAILDALDGFADMGQYPDDIISTEELIAYVKSEVTWRSKSLQPDREPQKPVGGLLQRSGEGADIKFVPVRPRLKGPLLRSSHSPAAEDRVAAAEQLAQRPPTDSDEVWKKKADELVRLATEDESLRVRESAVRGLGLLGHPDGLSTLQDLLLHPHDVLALQKRLADEPAELRAELLAKLRSAAAAALGELFAHPEQSAPRQAAMDSLIEALDADEDKRVLEQVKVGLGRSVASAKRLAGELEKADSRQKRHILDALACLGANPAHLEDEAAWPAVAGTEARALRRLYLTRRQMQPWWPDVRRRALTLGIYGAVGLSLAYTVVLFVARRSVFATQGPAVLSYNLLPGALGGLGLAIVPRLMRSATRRPGLATVVVSGLLAGLSLGVGMAAPNWFLGLGREGPYPLLWYLLPGVIAGPLLGLALVWLLGTTGKPGAGQPTGGLEGILRQSVVPLLGLALVGAVGFALGRIPATVSFGTIPHAIEVSLWALGGAILGAALATGWTMPTAGMERPTQAESEPEARGGQP